jgi:hypothetical protein
METKETLPGTKAVADRMAAAEENFIEVIIGKGFTREEAIQAMATMLKLKAAKMDAVIGRISVVHGAFLEREAISNAINYAPQRKGAR